VFPGVTSGAAANLSMKITAITCACARPEAWDLCKKYMARQTRQPDQWIVLDDDEQPSVFTPAQHYVFERKWRGPRSMVDKVAFALDSGIIEGDALAFIENDDWYAPNYLEATAIWLNWFPIVGEGRALYYNVRGRWWFEHPNTDHTSLCQTTVRRDFFPDLRELCREDPKIFLDWRITMLQRPRYVYDSGIGPKLVVGMKAMPGRAGYGNGHKDDLPRVADPDLSKLRTMIGADADAYAGFYQQ
jgi:hypothetical protein